MPGYKPADLLGLQKVCDECVISSQCPAPIRARNAIIEMVVLAMENGSVTLSERGSLVAHPVDFQRNDDGNLEPILPTRYSKSYCSFRVVKVVDVGGKKDVEAIDTLSDLKGSCRGLSASVYKSTLAEEEMLIRMLETILSSGDFQKLSARMQAIAELIDVPLTDRQIVLFSQILGYYRDALEVQAVTGAIRDLVDTIAGGPARGPSYRSDN